MGTFCPGSVPSRVEIAVAARFLPVARAVRGYPVDARSRSTDANRIRSNNRFHSKEGGRPCY
jgi:hypothetical protein